MSSILAPRVRSTVVRGEVAAGARAAEVVRRSVVIVMVGFFLLAGAEGREDIIGRNARGGGGRAGAISLPLCARRRAIMKGVLV